MRNKTVSVIVPVYNAEQYLARCIDSVLKQTYQYIELILIDDGSKDKSPVICDTYRRLGHNIKVIHQSNKGVSAARNTGLNLASGEYVTFVDADDALTSDAIIKLVEAIEHHRADIVSGGVARVDSTGNRISLSYTQSISAKVYRNDDLMLNFLSGNAGTSACARIYRMESVQRIRFDEGVQINEDKLFLYRCLANSRSHVYVNSIVYLYYQLADSTSHRGFSEKYFDIMAVANIIYNDISITQPQLLKAAINHKTRALMELYAYMSLSKTARSKFSTQYRDIRGEIANSSTSRLNGSIANLRLFIIRYLPVMFIPLALAYDWLWLRKRQL